jgi:phosphate/sulfate permease
MQDKLLSLLKALGMTFLIIIGFYSSLVLTFIISPLIVGALAVFYFNFFKKEENNE